MATRTWVLIAGLAGIAWLATAHGHAEQQQVDAQQFDRLIRTEEARNRTLEQIARSLDRIADHMPQR